MISPSKVAVYDVPFLGVCLMAGIGTRTWFSQLSAEFHTFITPNLKSAGQKYLYRSLLSC